MVLTDGRFSVPAEVARHLTTGDVGVDERPIVRLRAEGGALRGVEFADGGLLEREVLFAQPRQEHVALVRDLGLALDDRGFVRIDETTRETSVPGIHAAGDLTTAAQSAIIAAAAGMQAAAMLNRSLAMETPPETDDR